MVGDRKIEVEVLFTTLMTSSVWGSMQIVDVSVLSVTSAVLASVQHDVRSIVAAMDDPEAEDADFDFPMSEDLADDIDAVMDEPTVITPRVALADIFDALSSEKKSPFRNRKRPSVGWTCDDLGGDGLCLGDAFAVEEPESTTKSPPTVTKSEGGLGSIEWNELQTMHPNKIFAISVQYIVQRAPAVMRTRRALKRKGRDWRYELHILSKDPMRDLEYNLCARTRSRAYYMMTAWISRLSGRSIRLVRNDMADTWVQNGKWKLLDDKVKCRFVFLWQLEKVQAFQDAFPELFDRRVCGRSSQTSFGVVAAAEVDSLPVTLCYGYLATYNTNLGLRDPEILQWVQQGLRGQELADKLKERELLKDAFQSFADFHKAAAEKHGFKAWAVAMEHSANAEHPARVHLHVYAGVDIRGGHVFMGMPKPRPVSKEALQWDGCAAPFVKYTLIRRPSPATILNGVSTGMYYVAGAKKSNLLLQASMYPFQDLGVVVVTRAHGVLHHVTHFFFSIWCSQMSLRQCVFDGS